MNHMYSQRFYSGYRSIGYVAVILMDWSPVASGADFAFGFHQTHVAFPLMLLVKFILIEDFMTVNAFCIVVLVGEILYSVAHQPFIVDQVSFLSIIMVVPSFLLLSFFGFSEICVLLYGLSCRF